MTPPLSHHWLWLPLLACMFSACNPGSRIASKQPIDQNIAVGTPEFRHAVKKITHTPWVEGNHVETLINGHQFYPSMLKAIRNAKKSITFETYAYVRGTAAYSFTQALCQRAKAGVNVHLVLDRIGSAHIGKDTITLMRKHGVHLRFYERVTFTQPWRLNMRDHRKIMVVDGTVGFTGGCGIADAWMGNAQNPKQWRENHYRVTGPVVAQLQQCFEDNWLKLGGAPLSGNAYYPSLNRTGNLPVQAFNSAPIDQQFTIPHLYRQVFASARKSIIIENAYILLDKPMFQAVLHARKRGVHIEMLVPSAHNDAVILRYLQRYQYRKLLAAGIHIYEYQPTMMHCKILVVDGIFSSVGSANMDPRSLYLNDESNINVISRSFAQQQIRSIEADKKKSTRITSSPNPWNPLTLPQRAAASFLFPHL